MRNGERRFSEKELSCVCPRYHCFNPYMNETPRRYVPGAARLPRRSSLRERASSLLKTRPCALFIFQQTFFTPGQRPTPNCFEKFVQRKETPASARQAEPASIYSHPAQRSSLSFLSRDFVSIQTSPKLFNLNNRQLTISSPICRLHRIISIVNVHNCVLYMSHRLQPG